MAKNASGTDSSQPVMSGAIPFIQIESEKIIDVTQAQSVEDTLRISVRSLSRKNKYPKYEKPCEDAHCIDADRRIFILMDGATRFIHKNSTYPNPSPAADAARIITETSHLVLSERQNAVKDYKEILRSAADAANSQVFNYNNTHFPEVDFLENDFANACGIISYIEGRKLFYTYLGDPQGYLIRDGRISLFTINQIETIEELYRDYSSDKTNDPIDFRKYVCSEVRNNPAHMHAFGTFTGEKSALEMLETGVLNIEKGDRVIFTSDGLLPLFKHNKSLFLQDNFEKMFDAMEQLEHSMNLRSDDKTLIAIDII